MHANQAPRCSLDVAAERELDGYAHDAYSSAPPEDYDERDARPSMVERFQGSLRPFTEEEIEAAKQPHPHVFQEGECGLFPVGEVSVLAAPGREGKTFTTIAIAVSFILGTQLVGLSPKVSGRVLIYSAEDDRRQYLRKIIASAYRLGQVDRDEVMARIEVPDLHAEDMDVFRTLVLMIDRQPAEGPAVTAFIQAMQEVQAGPDRVGLIFFETASTVSEADEDNRSFRSLMKALKRIATALDVAVVLVHHTSQAAASNLPDLNLSAADIRGATALAYNSRQNLMLVNLGSDSEPFPPADLRTVLRALVAPECKGRITMLVALDTSKGQNPPPAFFEWDLTPHGVALRTLPVPLDLRGASWKQLHGLLRASKAEMRQSAKDEKQSVKVSQVVEIVARLSREGRQPTVKQVSLAAGRGPSWALPYLEQAVDQGELARREEKVPRTKGLHVVFRPLDYPVAPRGIEQ